MNERDLIGSHIFETSAERRAREKRNERKRGYRLRDVSVEMVQAMRDIRAHGWIERRALVAASLARALVRRGFIERDQSRGFDGWKLTAAGVSALLPCNCSMYRKTIGAPCPLCGLTGVEASR